MKPQPITIGFQYPEYTFYLGTSHFVGTVIAHSQLDYSDKYSIAAGDLNKFSINALNGQLNYIGTDREDVTLIPSYSLIVAAYDGNYRATAAVTVIVGICDRTPPVRTELASLTGVNSCNQVTTAGLSGIGDTVSLENLGISSLAVEDFAGLSHILNLVLSDNVINNLPADAFSSLNNLTSLDLQNNQLSNLPADVFSSLNNLTSLDLQNNQLSNLPADVFSSLNNLTALDLQNNQLSNLPADVFSSLNNLTSLDLQNNQLSNLPANVFSSLNNLTALDLQNNQLSNLPADVFSSLNNLTALDLQNNQLSNLPADVFSGLTSLLYLDLTGSFIVPVVLAVEPISDIEFRVHSSFAGPAYSSVTWEASGGNVADRSGIQEIVAGTASSGVFTLPESARYTTITLTNSTLRSGFNGFTTTLSPAIHFIIPYFDRLPYTFTLNENVPGTVVIGTVIAIEPTDTDNLDPSYSLDRDGNGRFSVDSGSGVVSYIGNGEDYENTPAYTLTVRATDSQDVTLFATVAATVVIFNIPEFVEPAYTFYLGERTLNNNVVVGTVSAPASNSTLYTITDGDPSKFSVDPTSGILSYLATDREDVTLTPNYTLTVTATTNDHSTTVTVAVIIGICDRTQPVREGIVSITGNASCQNVTLADLSGVTDPLDLKDQAISSLVTIDFAGLGNLEDLILESNDLTSLPQGVFNGLTNLTALNLQNNRLSNLPNDVISGLDNLVTLDLTDNLISDVLVIEQLNATDFRVRGILTWVEYTEATWRASGGGRDLDGSVKGNNVTSETFTPMLNRHTTITLTSITINPLFVGIITTPGPALTIGSPLFDRLPYTFTLNENVPGTVVIGTVIAIEPTDTDNLDPSYSLDRDGNGRFSVDSGSGVVSYIGNGEDYENTPAYTLTVRATDSQDVTLFATVAATVVIFNIPEFVEPAYTFYLGERTLNNNVVVGTVSAPASNSTLYTITDGDPSKFSVDPTSGILSYLATDREDVTLTPNYTLTVTATTNDHSTTVTVAVIIGICDRTQPVREGIVSITGNASCQNVTLADLSRVTDTLDLKDQAISSLVTIDFAGLRNLENLILESNDLTSLPQGVFDFLFNLFYLDAGENRLSNLPENLFSRIRSTGQLQHIFLNANQLSNLPRNVFAGLNNLSSLSLTNSEVTVSLTSEQINSTEFRIHSDFAGPSYSSVSWEASGGIVADLSGTVVIPAGTTSSTTFTLPLTAGYTTLTLTSSTLRSGFTGFITSLGPALSIAKPTGICNRTQLVQDAILNLLSIILCDAVTAVDLASITSSLILNGDNNAEPITELTSVDFVGLSNLDILSLSNNQISSLPDGVLSGLSSLRVLSLDNNQISSLPDGVFGGLSTLEHLDLQNNQISSLPDGVFGDLSTLEHLDLQNNQISSLPDGVLSGLSTLEYLYLQNNQISSLPDRVFGDLSLRVLDLQNNQIGYLQDQVFFGLDKLLNLYISSNPLTALSADVFLDTPLLIQLHVDNTELDETIPPNLFRGLDILLNISLVNGNFTTFPEELFQLGKIIGLDLRSNELTRSNLPDNIFTGLGTGYGLLDLGDNPRGNPMDIPVNLSLEQVNDTEFRVRVDFVGAWFTAVDWTASGDTVADLHGSTSIISGTAASPKFTIPPDYNTISLTDSTVRLYFGGFIGVLPAAPTIIRTLRFDNPSYSFFLDKNEPGTVAVGTLIANDSYGDTPTYSLLSGDISSFSLDVNSGEVNYIGGGETDVTIYTLTAQASNSDENTTATVTVTIIDRTPVYVDLPYVFSLEENQAGPIVVGTVAATDSDDEIRSVYTLIDGDVTRFSVDLNSGIVSYIGTGEDFESTENYTLTVQADNQIQITTAMVTINILNQIELQFIGTLYTFGLSTTDIIGTVTAAEGSITPTYMITVGDPNRFSINADSGILSYIGTVEDVTFTPSYTLTVTATSGSETDSATVIVNIGICDRTLAVRAEIIATINGDDDRCGSVTTDELNAISTYLYLNGSTTGSITSLQAFDFAGLYNLQTLYLYTHPINKLPDGLFDDTKLLNSLRLNGTDISALPASIFQGLNKLNRIDLQNNSLTALPENIFQNLPALTNIQLNNNQLSSLPTNLFNGLSLYSLYLHDNLSDFPVQLSLERVDTNLFQVRSSRIGPHYQSIRWEASGGNVADISGTVSLQTTLSTTSSTFSLPVNAGYTTLTLTSAAFPILATFPSYVIYAYTGFSTYLGSPLAITSPHFDNLPYIFNLDENLSGETIIGTVSAVEFNNSDNLGPMYNLNGDDRFSIDTTSGVVSYIGSGEDYENTPSYTLTVQAEDGNPAALIVTATITVNILDVDEASTNTPPVFVTASYSLRLAENQAGPLTIGTVVATYDDGTAPNYTLVEADSRLFSIHASGGVVSYIGSGEDYESTPGYTLTIQATNSTSDALFVTIAATVTIVDGNDRPAFVESIYTFSLAQNQPGPITIGTVVATDESANLTYSLVTSAPTLFQINPTTGEVLYIGLGENQGDPISYTLTAQVSDDTTAATAPVVVTIINFIGNFVPKFIRTPYAFSLNEDASSDVIVGSVIALDTAPDVITYALTVDGNGLFSIGTASGVLSYIGSGEDFKSTPAYTLTVTASDSASPALSATSAIVVAIGEVENTAPVFVGAPYSFDLDENQAGAVLLGTVSATDNASTVSYALLDDTPARFSLAPISGALSYIGTGEDIDSTPAYTLTVTASDAASPALSTTAAIVIAIGEVENTAPVFVGAPYTFDLDENQPGPVLLGTVIATDNASTVSYALLDDTPARFSLAPISGALSYIGSGEDFESIESYTLTVTATDTASPALTAAATIVVAIGDVDDAPNTAPVFVGAPYTFDLDENQSGPVLLGSVSATDNASTVSYALLDDTPARFSLAPISGALSYIGSGEDFESIESYTLTVTATDTASPALTTAATIVVAIGDVDEAPNTAPVFVGAPYTFDLDENRPGPVLLGSVSATDNASTVSYALLDDTLARFSLAPISGALSYIGSGEDFESIESYTLTVTATDTASPALTAAATIVVAIGDVDDAPNTAPVFVGAPYSFDLDENRPGPVLLGTVSATDNASTVSYALLDDTPARFSLAPISGALSYIGSGEDFESIESYTLTVTATDTASPALTAAATIVVAIGDVDDAPNTAPVFVGVPYTFDLDENRPGPVLLGTVSATDNASTVSYALLDDTPARFSLAPISGALSYIGSGEDFESIESYTLTVTATDTASPALTAAATIVVAIGDVDDAPNTAPVFVGVPYTFDLDENQPGPVLLGSVSATDNASTVSYALLDDTLARFSLAPISGALSYIGSGEDFESIESYTLTVTASDTASPALTAAATIVVAIGDVDDAPNTAPVFVGAPYTFDLDENQAGAVLLGTVAATDNARSVSYALLDDYSARFSLHTTSGVLSYIGSGEDIDSTPAYTLTVTASDAASPALSATAAIVIAIGEVENTAPVFIGTPYSFDLDENRPGPVLLGSVTATDNASSVSYALRDDTPARFSLAPISGALSYIGSGEDFESIESYTLTVTATDTASPALTAAATIVVAIGDVDDTPNTAPVFVGAPYSFDLDENQAGAVLLGTVAATDNARSVSYALLDDYSARFSLHTVSGALSYIGTGEDIDSTPAYTLTVTASDAASPALSTTAAIVVAIGEVDDAPNTAPVFVGAPYTFDLDENQPGPVLLGSVSATDNASTVSYALLDDTPARFSLAPISGALSYIGSGEDFESIESYTLTVTATDTASPALSATSAIVVAIGEVENTAPVFIGTPYSFDLDENQAGPVLLGSVAATDNARSVSYALLDDYSARFSLHTTSGALSYIGSGEDIDSTPAYTLTVTASDAASPALSATAAIVIAIGEVENTAPVFIGTPYSFDLDENQPGPVLLGSVIATDNASTVSYALRDDTPARFSLAPISGALSYIGSGEDFESIESYTLTVTATDTSSPALTTATAIVVAIGDVDDTPNTAPVFVGAPYSFDLDENQPGPVLLGSVSATDNASTVSYALLDDTPARFSLHTVSGALSYIGTGEDIDSTPAYTLTVTASDAASPALSTTAAIVIAIGEVENTAPVFVGAPYSFDLDENQTGPVLLGSVSATDNASTVSYALLDDTPARFSLAPISGALSYIGSGEDFESIESYTLTVTATDTASPALTAAATIVVAIGDVDDAPNTAPVFVGAPYRFDLDENQPGPVLLGTVIATDNASTVSYALLDDTPARFSLAPISGALSYIGSGEDFESIESYTLTVTATDTASPALTAAATIVVAIGDVDDAPNTAPVFVGAPYSFVLDENQPGPVLLGTVSATDNASTVSYALLDDTAARFSLAPISGALSYIGSGEDFESIESYTLTVTATDTASPALTAAATIVVAIGDVDDAPNTAPVFVGAPYRFDLDENQPGPVLLGTVIATDNASTVSYALLDDTPARFSLAPISGALSYIGSGEDFESIESYTLTVTATDTASPALTAAATIVVAIGDVDDTPNTAPVFVGAPYSFDLDENQPGPVLLGTVSATDNASTVSYALLDDTPARFSLAPISGALSYIGSGEDFESIESYTLTVTASDAASPALTAAATIVVAIGDVDDAPNTAPVFVGAPYRFDLDENRPGPVLLGTVSATDNASTVSYALRDDTPTRFSLHTTSGALSYIGSGEDFESIESYTLTVTASDTASPALTAAATIVVAIGDVDDAPNTAPVFVGAPYRFDLDENQPGPVLLGSVSATDNASTVSYALRDDTPARFSLAPISGALSYIGSGEDFESIESYTLTVTATDTASPALTAAATIVVAIGDVDEAPNTAPVFVGAPYTFDLDENQPGPVLLGSVSATDNASTVSYALLDDTPARFSLAPISGALSYIGSGEDFESIESYTLTVTASDTASPALTAAATIVVAIGDVDDAPNTAPVFIGTPYSFDLDENQPGPVRLGTVSATDNASTVSYALRDDYPTRFSLHTTSGALSYIGSGEDFESIESYTLTVTASDTASPALTAAATIVVAIGDVDDAPNTAPVFIGTPYTFDLDENQPGPVLLGSVSATDNASTVSYALRDDYPTRFSLHTTSGALSYIGSGEDFESIESYTLTVTASDTASPALTAAATIVVAIGDVDDAPNTAPVFVGAPYRFDLDENQPGPVLLGSVSATDNASTVSYALLDDTAARFSLAPISGALSYIGSGEDFESIESYTLTVTASDTASPALTAAATIVVAIGDVDDAPNTAPVFVGAPYTFDLDENQPGPVLLGSVSATDNASTVSYALLDDTPARFSLAPISGALSYIGSGEDFESIESYTLTVTASDTASPALTAAATIVVAIGDVDDAPNTAPVFVGAPYTFDLDENQPGPVLLGSVSATDNASTVSYALLDDTPARFSLAPISGALSYIGSGEDFESIESYTLTVTASDTASPALTAAATIVVAIGDVDDAPNTAPVFVGAPYTFDLDENQPGPVRLGTVSATDNASTVSYALLDDTPARFSLAPISGALSYIGSGEDFESIESYTLTVTATDTASPALTAAATIVVAIGDVDDAPNTAPVFVGAPYRFDLDENQPGPVLLGSVSATDNASTVSYALLDDTAARFSLAPISGALSYIGSGEDFESIESYTLTVTASDTASPALTAAATIVVAIGDVDDAPNTAPVFVGAPYSFDLDENQQGPVLLGTVSATDNASTVSYALLDDTPARFSLAPISGALSYIGSGEDFESIESYTLTVTATDTASPALTAAATIVVAIGDVDDAPNTAPVFVGAPYRFDLDENQPGPVLLGTVSATDNASTVSYALRDDYPTRFSLHTISGALSYIGSGEDFESIESYTLTVTASDTASPALTAAATIVVAIGDVDDAPNTAPVFVGAPYTFDLDENQPGPVLLGTVSATDNASSVSYALRDDTPTRFSLHTISGALSYIGSGEPETASYNLTVEASDGSLTTTAMITVVVTAAVDMEERTRILDDLQTSWSRIIIHDTVDIISGRFSEVPHTTVLNRPLRWNMLRWSDVVPRWNGVEREFKINIPNIKLDDLIYGSSFLLPLNADDDGSSLSDNNWHVWGRGRSSHVERKQDGLDIDTVLHSYYAGTDYRWSDQVLAGVAVSYSRGEGKVLNTAQDKTEVDLELGSVYPYIDVSLREGLNFWGLVGLGRGDTEIRDISGVVQTDLQMQMAALGLRTKLRSSKVMDMTLKLDLHTVEMTTDAVSGLINATEVKTHRLRMALAAKTEQSLSAHGRVTADAELGGRLDAGDTSTGAGLELGLGIGYTDTELRFGADLRGRWLLAHQDSSRKEWSWGTGLDLYLRASPLGRGLSFSWTPGWGGPLESQVGSLWQNGVKSLDSQSTTVAEMSWKPHRQQLSLGYGWGIATGLLTPFAEMKLSGGDLDRVRFGTRFAIPLGGSELRLSLHGNRLSTAEPIHHQLGVDVSVGF